jgi:hypothetical protein
LVDFLSLNNSKLGNPTTMNTITFTGIKFIETPTQLASVINAGLILNGSTYDGKIYINGTRYYQTTHFTCSINSANTLTINFIPSHLGFNVDSADEIIITGKFVNV